MLSQYSISVSPKTLENQNFLPISRGKVKKWRNGRLA